MAPKEYPDLLKLISSRSGPPGLADFYSSLVNKKVSPLDKARAFFNITRWENTPADINLAKVCVQSLLGLLLTKDILNGDKSNKKIRSPEFLLKKDLDVPLILAVGYMGAAIYSDRNGHIANSQSDYETLSTVFMFVQSAQLNIDLTTDNVNPKAKAEVLKYFSKL